MMPSDSRERLNRLPTFFKLPAALGLSFPLRRPLVPKGPLDAPPTVECPKG